MLHYEFGIKLNLKEYGTNVPPFIIINEVYHGCGVNLVLNFDFFSFYCIRNLHSVEYYGM